MIRKLTQVNGPVATIDDLPLGDAMGSVRLVQDEDQNYICVRKSLVLTDQWRKWDGEEILANGPDLTAPVIQSITVAGSGGSVTFRFSERVIAGSAGFTGYILSLTNGAVPLTYASGNNSRNIVFSPSRTIAGTETGTGAYTSNADRTKDLAGNLLATVSGISVTNGSSQFAPVVTSATIPTTGNSLTVNLSKNVTGFNGFSITASGGTANISHLVSGAANQIIFTTSRNILAGETVTLDYAPGNVVDGIGLSLAAFSNLPVTNNSTAEAPGDEFLASFGVGDGTFTRTGYAGFTGNGDADDFQREVGTDIPRDQHYVNGTGDESLILEDTVTPIALVAPGSVTATDNGDGTYDLSWTDAPVTVDRLRAEYREDDTGSWVSAGTATSVSNIATSNGAHVGNVRFVSTSGVAGAQGDSNTVTVTGGGGGEVLIKLEDFNTAAPGGTHAIAGNITGWVNSVGHVDTTDIWASPGAMASGVDPSISYYDGGETPSLDQRAEFTWLRGPNATNTYIGPAVRCQSGSVGCYCLLSRQGRTYLEKFVAGVETELDHVDLTPADGEVWLLRVSGSGSATRLQVQRDTGSGFANVTGVGGSWASVDPGGTYLGAGFVGLVCEGLSNNTVVIDNLKWYDE